MKQINITFYRLLLFLLTVGMVSACSEKIDMGSFVPETPEYSIEGGDITIPKEGGEFTVNVKSNLPWRAKSNASWITLVEESGLGDGKITFTASRNRSVDPREGELIVWVTSDGEKRVKVVQLPSEPSDLVNHYYVKVTGNDSNDGLSWENPITLVAALDRVAPGDIVHIAEGTYVPVNRVTNGNADGDVTFEIHSNITLIGGYPSDAKEGDQPDPENHPTILSGNHQVFHTMVVTAPVEEGKSVVLRNLVITGGSAGNSSAGTLNISGHIFRRSYGGGMNVGGSHVEMYNCKVTGNESGQHAAGIYMFDGAVMKLVDCDITENKGVLDGSNGGGIFNESSTLYMTNCSVMNNTVWGVGAGVYTYSANTNTYLYLYNCTVSGNSTNAGPNTNRRGGGLYAREFTRGLIVNSTFHGNESGNGGGISLYGAAGKTSEVTLISSTVTDNYAINKAAGVETLANTTLKAYNSIVAGNRAVTNADMESAANTASLSYMVVGSQLRDGSGAAVSGVTFDAATMLGALTDNGGRTPTVMLSASSPAATMGMDVDELRQLSLDFNPPIDLDIILKDQTGVSREGKKAMGAVVPR
ncbi:Putative binding domain-containing protein, N-terminal [Porphyromonadaceae bacterium KHP3R9]|jgi:hypothetical protein|nr:Putative binding domain-containing protein, N-terminal [Porphyromonadaceae bacterium KHP3R9]